jgi:transcriptional regulator with XRE-family HTH domain
MTIEEFLNAPISELAKASGIAKENLWRYLNGQPVTEKTLNRLAIGLDMPVYKVLEAIVIRRKKEVV